MVRWLVNNSFVVVPCFFFGDEKESLATVVEYFRLVEDGSEVFDDDDGILKSVREIGRQGGKQQSDEQWLRRKN